MGQSKGGMVATRICQLRPELFSGLILLTPWYQLHPSLQPGAFFKRFLSLMFSPDSTIEIPVRVKENSEIHEYWKYRSDHEPLLTSEIRIDMLLEAFELQTEFKKDLDKLSLPILIFTAGYDQLVDNAVTR